MVSDRLGPPNGRKKAYDGVKGRLLKAWWSMHPVGQQIHGLERMRYDARNHPPCSAVRWDVCSLRAHMSYTDGKSPSPWACSPPMTGYLFVQRAGHLGRLGSVLQRCMMLMVPAKLVRAIIRGGCRMVRSRGHTTRRCGDTSVSLNESHTANTTMFKNHALKMQP